MRRTVAVVIPFFQRAKGLLHKAVQSALSQQGDFQLRFIIVDDESPISARSELGELLTRYPDKFLLVTQKNMGCFGASNTGLDQVGPDVDYIAFLDSDDEWFDGHLPHAVWALERGYDFYFADFYQLNQTVTAFDRAKKIRVADHPRIHPSEPIHEFRGDMRSQILEGNVIGVSTIVFNASRYRDLRYIQSVRMAGAEYVFFLNLAIGSNKIAFSSVPECRYGGGVNVFAESGWGTNKFLHLRHDEILTRKFMLSLPLTEHQKKVVRQKINQARMGFARGLFHNLGHGVHLDKSLLTSLAKADIATYLFLIVAPAVLLFERLKTKFRASAAADRS